MAGPWYHDPAGDDSDGLTWATAYKTIAQCHAAAGNGEIINTVGGESPAGDLVFTQTPLTMVGFNPATHTEDGTVAIFDGASTRSIGFRFSGANVIYKNIEYKNCTTYGVYSSATGQTFFNFITRGSGVQGIRVSSTYTALLNHSSVGDAIGATVAQGSHIGRGSYLNSTGIAVTANKGSVIETCLFEGCAHGIDTGINGATAKNNTFETVTGTAIKCDGPSTVLENRFIVPAGGTGLLTSAGIYVSRGDNGYYGAGTHRTLSGIDIDLGGDTDMASAGTVSAADLSTDPAGEVVAVSTDIGAVGDLGSGTAFVTAGLPPAQGGGGGGARRSRAQYFGRG